jgi:hypothetical protein
MSIEAMKQALAKFESLWEIGIDAVYRVELLPEIQALRQAIEQAEKQEPEQEPVAWDGNCVLGHCGSPDGCDRSGCCRADTAPPRKEWVGLNWDDIPDVFVGDISFFQGANWAQAKLKEKNGG